MRHALAAMLTASACIACSTDAYDKGEGQYSQMQAEMVVAHADGDRRVTHVDTDRGERLTVSPPFTTGWIAKGDSTYRGLLYYKAEGSTVTAFAFSRVAMLTPRHHDSPKTDPVKMESMWMSANHSYLNASIYLMTGTSDTDGEAIHTIGASIETVATNTDGTRTCRLQLVHDQGGVPQYYSQRTFISIPMTGVDADSVCLGVNTYGGMVLRTFALR